VQVALAGASLFALSLLVGRFIPPSPSSPRRSNRDRRRGGFDLPEGANAQPISYALEPQVGRGSARARNSRNPIDEVEVMKELMEKGDEYFANREFKKAADMYYQLVGIMIQSQQLPSPEPIFHYLEVLMRIFKDELHNTKKLEETSRLYVDLLLAIPPSSLADKLAAIFQAVNILHGIGKDQECKDILLRSFDYKGPTFQLALPVASKCRDLGFYTEAQSTISQAREFASKATDEEGDIGRFIVVLENLSAQIQADNDNISECLAKLKELRTRLEGVSPPRTTSRHFQTILASIESVGGKAVCKLKLEARTDLPESTFLVCSLETEEGQAPVEATQILGPKVENSNSNKKVKFNVEEGEEEKRQQVKFDLDMPTGAAKEGYYITRVDLYKDPSRADRLGSHFVLAHCKADISKVD